MASGGGKSILEMWLGDTPNSNNSSVKKERKDLNDLFNPPSSSSSLATTSSTTNTTNSVITHHTHSSAFPFSSSNVLSSENRPSNTFFPDTSIAFPGASSNFNNAAQSQSIVKSTLAKIDSANIKPAEDPIDATSIQGIFGWTRSKEVILPYILRKSDKLVPVRIVESKIIGRYSGYLPWKVFSCINIRSYFITENEAKLLNEINSFHSDFFFGYEVFTCKDVVVCLSDVDILHKFLETSRLVFEKGLDSCPFLGFVKFTDTNVILPYIHKQIRINTGDDLNSTKKLPDESKSENNSNRLLNEMFPDLFDSTNDKSNDDSANIKANGQSLTAKINETQRDSSAVDSSNVQALASLSDDNSAKETNLSLAGDRTEAETPSSKLTTSHGDEDVIVCSKPLVVRKFVPRSLISHLVHEQVESLQMTEWDASYLKMICIYAGFDQLITQMGKVVVNSSTGGTAKPSDDLCSLESLNIDLDHYRIDYVEHRIPHVSTNSSVPSANSSESNRFAPSSNTITNPLLLYSNQLNRLQSDHLPNKQQASSIVAPHVPTNSSPITNPISHHINPHGQLQQHLAATRAAYQKQQTQPHQHQHAHASQPPVQRETNYSLRSTNNSIVQQQQEAYNHLLQAQKHPPQHHQQQHHHHQHQANSYSSMNSSQIPNRQVASSSVNTIRSNPCIRPARPNATANTSNSQRMFDLNNSALAATLTSRTLLPNTRNMPTNSLQSHQMSSSSNNSSTNSNNSNSNTNSTYDSNLLNQLYALLPNNLSNLNTHEFLQQQQLSSSLANQNNTNMNLSTNSNSIESSANWLSNFLNNTNSLVNNSTSASASNSSSASRASNLNANQLLNDLLTRSSGLISQQLQQTQANHSQIPLQSHRSSTNNNTFASQTNNQNLWNGLASNQLFSQTIQDLHQNSLDCLSSSQTAGTSSNSLRSLNEPNSSESAHRIYRVEIGGCSLRAINLFPGSTFLVVLVGEIAQKLLTGITYMNLVKILENVFEFQLFDILKEHEIAFIRSGYKPITRDKLVRVDILKVSLPLLKQFILTQGGQNSSHFNNQTKV